MESEGSVPDAHEVAAALRVAVGLLYRKLKQTSPNDELTLAESSTLSRLERGGPASSSDLARHDRISPQSMGVTVAALEDRGLIERGPRPRGRPADRAVDHRGRAAADPRQARRADRADRGRAARRVQRATSSSQLKAVVPLLERLAEKL